MLPSDGLVSVEASGEVTKLPITLDCGDTPFCLIAAGDELVISSVARTQVFDPAQPDGHKTKTVGPGWITVPSQQAGRVWLGILARGELGGDHTRGLSEVREVDLDGRVIRRMRPPGGSWPVEALEDGVVFQNRNSMNLWSFAERRFTARLPGAFPLDAEGNAIASCDDPCGRIVVTDVQSGEVARLTPPTGYHWVGGYDGAFSPDSSRLAVPITEGDGRSYRIDGIAVVDLATGSARVVPRSRNLDRSYGGAMAWSPTGDHVYFVQDSGAVMSYDPSTDEATKTARLPQKYRGAHGSVIELVALPSAGE